MTKVPLQTLRDPHEQGNGEAASTPPACSPDLDKQRTMASNMLGSLSRSISALAEATRAKKSALAEARRAKRSALAEAKKFKKWHDAMRQNVGYCQPNSPEFPWLLARQFTLEYLGRETIPNVDDVMLNLIHMYPRKLQAFAACVGFMSDTCAKATLRIYFKLDPRDDSMTDDSHIYFQALHALFRSRPETVPEQDVAFLHSLLNSPYSRIHFPPPHRCLPSIVLSPLANTTPSHKPLYDLAETLIRRFCCKARNMFDAMLRPGQLRHPGLRPHVVIGDTKEYAKALSFFENAHPFFRAMLEEEVPEWRAWVNWQPRTDRILLRNTIDMSCQLLHKLIRLEEPDFGATNGFAKTKGEGLVKREELAKWLENNDCQIGPDGFGTWAAEFQYGFLEKTLDFADRSQCSDDSTYRLFYIYMERLGLRWDTVERFESVCELLGPVFIRCLSTTPENYCSAANFGSFDNIVLQSLSGICAFPRSTKYHVLSPLRNEIGLWVQAAADVVLSDFRSAIIDIKTCFDHARRLFRLREIVREAVWMHESVSDDLVRVSCDQEGEDSLLALETLHKDLSQPHTRIVPGLEPHVRISLLRFAASGKISYDVKSVLHLDDASDVYAGENGVIAALHILWMGTDANQSALKSIATSIACLRNIDVEVRIAAIEMLPNTKPDLLGDLLRFWNGYALMESSSCFELTRCVWALMESPYRSVYWTELLRWFLKERAIDIDRARSWSPSAIEYLKWLQQLVDLDFGDEIGLCPSMREWVWEPRASFKSLLEYLTSSSETENGKNGIVAATRKIRSSACRAVLSGLSDPTVNEEQKKSISYFLLTASSRLVGTSDSTNWQALSVITQAIARVDASATAHCQYVFSHILSCTCYVAARRLTMHSCMPDLEDGVKDILSEIGYLIRSKIHGVGFAYQETDADVLKSYSEQVTSLLAKARNLERARFALQRSDAAGVAQLTEDLGLDSLAEGTITDSLMMDLPTDLEDVIERVGDDSIELYFPLQDLNTIQRLAFGLKGTEILFAHLELTQHATIASVCIHLEERGNYNTCSTADHTTSNYVSLTCEQRSTDEASLVSKETCGQASRLVYLVAQTFWLLRTNDEIVLDTLYRGVRDYIRSAANQCMICRIDIGAKLSRPVVCKGARCSSTFSQWNTGLRLQDFRDNSLSVNLMLTAVYATVKAEKHLDLLLPGLYVNHAFAKEIVTALSGVKAPLEELYHDCVRRKPLAHKDECGLLSWVCNAYNGFLISATGSFKIPNLPNIQQFLLVNASPEVEAAFAKHQQLQPRHILFHGTSLDRLYAILTQGLRVLSGGSLQRHGAARGPGIYMAREPSVALGWARSLSSTIYSTEVQPAFFKEKSRSAFYDGHVMLGCEHAGNDLSGARGDGIHVINDPSRVIVRYVWIVPPNTMVPRAQDVRIPMLGTFSTLKASLIR